MAWSGWYTLGGLPIPPGREWEPPPTDIPGMFEVPGRGYRASMGRQGFTPYFQSQEDLAQHMGLWQPQFPSAAEQAYAAMNPAAFPALGPQRFQEMMSGIAAAPSPAAFARGYEQQAGLGVPLFRPQEERYAPGAAPGTAGYEQMLSEYQRWGYSPEELGMLLESKGMALAPAATAGAYLGQYMEQQYGPMPMRAFQQATAGGIQTGDPSIYPLDWRYRMPGWRGRMTGAYPVSERPPASQWDPGYWTRQGAHTMFPVEQTMASSIMLPGQEPGQYMATFAPEKAAKRIQMSEAHRGLELWGAGGQSLQQQALMPTGPGFPVPGRGIPMQVGIPMAELFVSGGALLAPGAGGIQQVGERQLVSMQLPQGFTPTSMPRPGAEFSLRRSGGWITPFQGLQQVHLGGGYPSARVVGRPTLTEEGQFQMLLEKYMRPVGAELAVKTGFAKQQAMFSTPQAWGNLMVGGGQDIEMLATLKDPLGAAWATMMAQSPQEVAGMLTRATRHQVTPEQLEGQTFQDIGATYARAFQEQLLAGGSPNIRMMQYRLPVAQEQIEAGYLENLGQWGEYQSRATGPGMFEVTTPPIPTFVGKMFTEFEREYPWQRPFLSYRELQNLQRVNPEMYAQVMQESAGTREAYSGVAQALLASERGGVPQGAVSLLPQGAAALVGGAQEAAMQAMGLTTPAGITREQMTKAILQQAAGEYGTSPIGIGQGRYLPPAEYLQGAFSAGGVHPQEEVGRIQSAFASSIQALAGQPGPEAEATYERAFGAFQEFSSGKEFFRRLTGAMLDPRRAGGRAISSSLALHPAEAVLPADVVRRQYGVTREEGPEFMARWYGGQIQPRSLFIPQPTRGEEPYKLGIPLVHPERARERGMEVDPRTGIILSPELIQAYGRDIDMDEILRMGLGHLEEEHGQMVIKPGSVPTATSQEVQALARQEETFGAASLRGELFSAPSGMQPGAGVMGQFAEALRPENMYQYTAETFQGAMGQRDIMQRKIGSVFNILESITGAMRRGGGGEEAIAGAQRQFNIGYGIAQRPEELPEEQRNLIDIMQTWDPLTGGYRRSTGQGPGYLGRLGELGTGLASHLMPLLRQGGLAPGEAFMSPGQFGAGLGATPELTERLTAAAQRYATGDPGARLGAKEDIFATMREMTPSQILRTGWGTAITGAGYQRAERILQRPESQLTASQRRTQAARRRMVEQGQIQGMAPEDVQYMQQAAGGMQAWRAAVGRRGSLGERAAGLEQIDPTMFQQLFPGLTAQQAAAAGGVVPVPEGVQAAFEEAQQIPSPMAGGAGAGGPNVPRGTVAAAAPAEPEFFSNIPAGGIPPVPPGATPFSGQDIQMLNRFQRARGGGGGAPGGPGGGGGGGGFPGWGDFPGVRPEDMSRMMNRLMGVSESEFTRATQGTRRIMEEYGDKVKELLESTDDLDKSQRWVVRQLSQWGGIMGRGLRQEEWKGMPGVGVEYDFATRMMRGGAGGSPQQIMMDIFGASAGMDVASMGRILGGPQMPGLGQMAGNLIGGRMGLMSPWGVSSLMRMWRMTGGAAMGRIPMAAQAEQAAAGAALMGGPISEYQPGTMGLDLMGFQAQQQNFGINVGRGAYGAWGAGMQMAPGLGRAAGIMGPAVGAGWIASRLGMMATGMGGAAAATGIGLPVAIGAGLYGGAQYLEGLGNQPGRTAWEYGGESPWRRFFAGRLPAALAGRLPGMDPSQTYNPLESGGLGNLWNWAWSGNQQAVQAWEQQQGQVGQQMRRGDLTGLSPAYRATAISQTAQELSRRGQPLEFMGEMGALQMTQQWMQQGWGDNPRQIMEDPRFAQMGLLGMQPGQFTQMARQWGMGPSQGLQMFDLYAGQETGQQRAAFMYNQQMLSPFARFGMTPEMMQGLPEITGAQTQYQLQGMARGSPFAWSQYGLDVGRQDLMTVNPQTGMGIGTNWGGGILGGRMGQVGAPGRDLDIRGENITFNVTGQTVGFNQWDIQDYGVQQQRGFQDWQTGFQRRGLELQGEFTMGTGQFAGRGVWDFQDAMTGLQRGYQADMMGFQRRGLDVSDRQFRERWGLAWERLGQGEEWWQQDFGERNRRRQVQFGWQLEDVAFRGAQTSLQFGWQMEDLEEAERFSTGRDRRRIRRQRERAAISYGMGMGQLETQEERIRERMQWGEEDQEEERERHETRLGWQREELQLQLRHHEERLDLSRDRLDRTKAYFDETNSLQDRQRDAARDYWELNHERQLEALDRGKEYRDVMREVEDAQQALSRAQQLQTNWFRAQWESGGLMEGTFTEFFSWLGGELATLQSDYADIFIPRLGQLLRSLAP